MIISCTSCKARYVVDPAKLAPAGRHVRCAKCQHSWFQPAAEIAVAPVVAAVVEKPPAPPAPPPPPPVAKPEPVAVTSPDPAPSTDGPADDFDVLRERVERLTRKREIRNLPAIRHQTPKGLIAGWAALAALLVAVFASSLFFFREDIARRAPVARSFYTALGLGVEDTHPDPVMVLRIVTPELPPAQYSNGVLIQLVDGSVENQSNYPISVPLLRGVVFDNGGKELMSWGFRAVATELAARQLTAFKTEILDMPASASRLEIMFDSTYRARQNKVSMAGSREGSK